jgi:hypothetical protein
MFKAPHLYEVRPRKDTTMHAYEVRPRKDKRGADLISDALPFGRLWYAGPNAVVKFYLGWRARQ